MNPLKALFNSRDKPTNRLGGGLSFLFGNTSSGKAVNAYTAMQTTAVYACVRILAEAIAGLPLHVYRYRLDGGKERVALHPLYYLLHNEPNPEMTSFVFRETLMSHLLLWGNAYAQVVRNGRGQTVALYPLLPNKMEVSRAQNGELVYTYYRDADESALKPKGGYVTLRKDEVLHIPGLGFDGLIGYSPIAMAKNAIGMSLATEEYGAAFFANGANPGGVLEHPGVIKDIQRVKDSWNSAYQGSANAHRVAVLEEGMKFQAIGIPPEQAQFLETRKFQINEIARIFRVPPHMVGDLEKSSFSNIEQQSLELLRAKALLDEVKESIINAYELKSGLSRTKLSHLMDAETWMNANKAIELGFADKVMFANGESPMDTEQGMIFSRAAVTNSLLGKIPKLKQKTGTPIESLDKRLSLISH